MLLAPLPLSCLCSTACRPHPLYAAPCAQAFLRRQREIHANTASEAPSATREYVPSYPVVAPDLSKCAIARTGPARLVVLALPGQRRLGSWQLQPPCNEPATWQWSHGSSCLAIPWGRSWGLTGVIGDREDRGAEPGPAGLCLVDTSEGGIALVCLGVQSADHDRPVLGPWLPCGLLAVRHLSSAQVVWSLFDDQGSQRHSVACPFLVWRGLQCFAGPSSPWVLCGQNAVAPAGDKLLLSLHQAWEPDRFFIWHVQGGAPVEAALPKEAEPAAVTVQRWSPDSMQVLSMAQTGLTLFHSCSGVELARQRIREGVSTIDWGVNQLLAVAFLACNHLHVYSVRGALLSLSHCIPGAGIVGCQPAFSPDGAHLACMLVRDNQASLAVFRSPTTLVRSNALVIDSSRASSVHFGSGLEACRWSRDGTRIGLTYTIYCKCSCLHLVDFG